MTYSFLPNRLVKQFFIALTLVAIGSASAYAKVESCPDRGTIQFNKVTHEWQTIRYDWKPIPADNRHDLGELSLDSVRLNINHKTGDAVECTYEGTNKQTVTFVKGSGAANTHSIKSIRLLSNNTRTEILPAAGKWGNSENKSVYECKPSSDNICKFDDVTPTPDPYGLIAANGVLDKAVANLTAELKRYKAMDDVTLCETNFISLKNLQQPVRDALPLMDEGAAKLQADINIEMDPIKLARLYELQTSLVTLPMGQAEGLLKEVNKFVYDALANICKRMP